MVYTWLSCHQLPCILLPLSRLLSYISTCIILHEKVFVLWSNAFALSVIYVRLCPICAVRTRALVLAWILVEVKNCRCDCRCVFLNVQVLSSLQVMLFLRYCTRWSNLVGGGGYSTALFFRLWTSITSSSHCTAMRGHQSLTVYLGLYIVTVINNFLSSMLILGWFAFWI